MSTPATAGGILSSIGSLITGTSGDVAAAENAATQAFTAIAGELVIIIILLAIIVGRNWD